MKNEIINNALNNFRDIINNEVKEKLLHTEGNFIKVDVWLDATNHPAHRVWLHENGDVMVDVDVETMEFSTNFTIDEMLLMVAEM